MDSFYTREELEKIGFASIGKNVLLSRKTSIGNNVRIDDFCILSGSISIGSYVHVSAYVALYGAKNIFLKDYSGISAKSIIYSAIDDFSGEHLIGPMVPSNTTLVSGGTVVLEKYTQIGASCVVLPNIIGAMSFVNKSLGKWGIYAGIPARRIKERSKELIRLL